MDQTQRSHLVAGLFVLIGGLLVTMAAIERLSSPTLRALGGREQLIMVGLVIVGVTVAILGGCEAAGFALLPDLIPASLACIGAMLAGVDAARIFIDSLRWLGDSPGPLGAAVPSSTNWALFLGAVLAGGGGGLLALARLGVFPRVEQKPWVSPKARKGDVAKTYHANRWWMRDGSGSVLVWDDQAQAWSPWVRGRDPGLPPGWS